MKVTMISYPYPFSASVPSSLIAAIDRMLACSRPVLLGCALLAALSGCGGGSGTGRPGEAGQVSIDTIAASAQSAKPGGGGGGGGGGTTPSPPSPINNGAYDPGLLLMLVPDNYAAADHRVAAWVDAASEQGVRLIAVTDTQFAALGANALRYAGLVLPDDLHSIATDATLAAVKSYVNSGGMALLTFDFGALTLDGIGQPVFPIPKSRLSDMAGVDYILYDELRDNTTGLGPVTGMRSMLRQLQVPPGKSMPYTPDGGSGGTTATTQSARYLPVSPSDPGGARGYDPQQFQNIRTPSVQERLQRTMRQRVAIDYGSSIQSRPVAGVTTARATGARSEDGVTLAAAPTPDELHAYTGYLLGPLTYPSYVTRGDYTGQTIASSPQFGLVAGLRSYGLGKVLFVNLPLTYLKGRTDALPMHGFLGYFATQVLRLPHLSTMPGGVPGLTLNWHFDSMAAQTPTLVLEQLGVFREGPFSIDMTAGPDTITPGDGLGWNLDHNPVAQDILRRLDAQGHAIGSHGGWIHDYYGLNATETNQADFEPYLVLNRTSVDSVIGRPGRQYSAPEGNNPTWAMDWLERQGVVGAYFGGHTGLGVTRHYRDGVLKNPNLSVFPVTPQGLYATLEEFEEFAVPKQAVTDWYHELIDFSVQFNTNRLIYMHPPGAEEWSDVLQDMLAYARAKGSTKFRWYTMPRLADHMAKRLNVTWTQTLLTTGATRFNASHPLGLAEMAWRLPKSRYLKPTVSDQKAASITSDGNYWLIKPSSVTVIEFTARPV
jgi:hypothetical protein